MFLSSVGVGSLFLVVIEYLGGAVWSVPFRRISEFFGAVLLILPIIAIPVYFNLHDLFHWTHIESVAGDKLLEEKSPYLNEMFFTIRVLAYFLIWIMFYLVITRNSRKQDVSGDQKLTKKNIRYSAIFIPVFAITLTFASIDWLMSLEPHWFSTIFGIYYFSGTVLTALAIATFAIVSLNEKGLLVKGITKDHYYSLGALMFAFTNFWAYIAFSQYLLIWYANLPEETFWFLARWEGSWMYFSIGLIIVRFLVPYIGLLSQPSKMNPKRLKIMSVWILFAHIYDLYWLIMPTYSKDGIVFGWIEFGFPLLAGGILILVFNMRAKNQNLVPIGDPKLKRGLNFRL
ncbi:MAG: quinol:cytochrome C oxidoreductase [Melioribacteraceae bacterium]|nr:quinol:cytochrome C oxidoreductase [Melioribacteraceae bacterium]MCF8354408.1 quinol:cytochrome C oxidoreductase [Melioribacteraceae bacterium]MCF8392995.1 quinol:cytochrome C oxidoreductase [Melioribacteraceae bacterium]MCF8417262.1 quinol:cytochrome C oxidoreductase [Melioribacteraceae bacterium]